MTILTLAVENRIGCVEGTHGRTGDERYLLGSVAEKVVRMAPMLVRTIAIGDTTEQHRQIEEMAPTSAEEVGRRAGTEAPTESDASPSRFD